jgi:hypothetical protein
MLAIGAARYLYVLGLYYAGVDAHPRLSTSTVRRGLCPPGAYGQRTIA